MWLTIVTLHQWSKGAPRVSFGVVSALYFTERSKQYQKLWRRGLHGHRPRIWFWRTSQVDAPGVMYDTFYIVGVVVTLPNKHAPLVVHEYPENNGERTLVFSWHKIMDIICVDHDDRFEDGNACASMLRRTSDTFHMQAAALSRQPMLKERESHNNYYAVDGALLYTSMKIEHGQLVAMQATGKDIANRRCSVWLPQLL